MPDPTLTQEELRNKENQRKAAQIKKWRNKNQEHVKAYAKAYRDSHPEVHRKSSLRYYYDNVKSDPAKIAKRNARTAAYDAANPDNLKSRLDRYKKNNRELLAAKAKAAYHAKSPEERKAERVARKDYYKQWLAENQERISAKRRAEYDKAEQNRRYREQYKIKRVEYIQRANARKRLLIGRGEFTQKDVDHILEQQNGKCAGCSVSLVDGYEIDHVMPVSLGGSNTADNLQLLCMPCNRRKHNMHPDDWKLKLKSA